MRISLPEEAQWPRIVFLAQQLIDNEGVVADPLVMPPFSPERS